MDISQDTKEVVKFLQEITGGNLRKSNDLEIFLELGAAYSQENLINNLIFYGASVWYLSKTFKKNKPGDQGFKKLENELSNSIEVTSRIIKSLSELADTETNDRFQKIYLQNSGGALQNLIDLAHDLSELKQVQIKMKSKK